MENKAFFSQTAVCQYVALGAVVLLGLTLRLYGVDWDQGHFLHPDERFLQMVTGDVRLPASFWQHLNGETSPLNPYKTQYTFFVYGMLPITLLKLAQAAIGSLIDIRILGRYLSAFADCGTLLTTYAIARLYAGHLRARPLFPVLAAFFYSITVLTIQSAHFFTVDSFLVFCATSAFYFFLRFHEHGGLRNAVCGGLCFGAALACKISSIYIAPLFAFFLLHDNWQTSNIRSALQDYTRKIPACIVTACCAYLALRICDPRLFASGNLLNPLLNPKFVANIKELVSQGGETSWFPPSVQWFHTTPVLFTLKNVTFFGLGPPYFLLTLLGIASFFATRRAVPVVSMIWLIVFFVYQSSEFSKPMRYFYIACPLFAILAAQGAYLVKSWTAHRNASRVTLLLCVVLSSVWPGSFMRIYTKPHSRVAASDWIHDTLPENSVIGSEHWDDGLPFYGSKKFTSREVPSFSQDDANKWQTMDAAFKAIDYLILTSNRGYGSILRVPERYPAMARFYTALFAGATCFEKIAEFSSYPGLEFGNTRLEFEDQWSEEPFTVYDHPLVTVFKKNKEREDKCESRNFTLNSVSAGQTRN